MIEFFFFNNLFYQKGDALTFANFPDVLFGLLERHFDFSGIKNIDSYEASLFYVFGEKIDIYKHFEVQSGLVYRDAVGARLRGSVWLVTV